MIAFSIGNLLDEQACYEFLLKHLHPEGLRCPKGHALATGATPHDRHRAPILDYRCKTCGSVFNLFSRTPWQKTSYQCSQILQGFAQGKPTLHLARELGMDRGTLLKHRHRMQGALQNARQEPPTFGGVIEADEMYENSGEKRNAASPSSASSTAPRGSFRSGCCTPAGPARFIRRCSSAPRRGRWSTRTNGTPTTGSPRMVGSERASATTF